MAQFSLMIPSSEASELSDDVRRLFEDLERSLDSDRRAYSGECHPALDVVETDSVLEITADVAGIPAAAFRVLFRADVLLIVGEKTPSSEAGEQTFHLVEREFGRFARAVRLNGAFDIAQARATLRDGELTVTLPKVADRRGNAHLIPITTALPSRS